MGEWDIDPGCEHGFGKINSGSELNEPAKRKAETPTQATIGLGLGLHNDCRNNMAS